MPPVFGPLVAVEDPLVVLRRRHRDRALAVAQRQQRELLADEVLLDDDAARRRSAARRGTSCRARAGLGLVRGDDDALAGGEAVELDDDRVALDRRHARRRRVDDRDHAAVGTPAAAMISLANAFEPSSRAAAAPSARTPRSPARRQRVDEAGDERRLRPDDDEVDVLALGAASTSPSMSSTPTSTSVASLGDPGVARAREHLGRLRRARQRPDDRVLAPAGADDEDLQHSERAMKSSIGIAASVS